MADNVTLNSGSGGATIATDDVGGIQFQRVKLSLGADGTAADAPIGGGVESGSLRVTIASDSTGVLSVDDNGSTLSIDDGGGSITVDGTVAVSGTVTVGSHAVTNAGTFATQVDGAALTALQLIDDVVATDDAAFTVATGKGAVMMGVVTTDSADSGDAAAVRITASRSVATVVTNSSGTIIDPQVDDAAFTPASGLVSVIGAIVTADSVDSGDAGAVAMTTARALHVAVQGTVAVTDNSGSLTVDNAGTFATQSTLQTGSALVGDVGLSGARTSGGTTIFRSLDIDETEEEIKATAGQVYWIHAMNLVNAKRYLKFYNATAANVTVGTTTPVLTFPLPTQGDTNGAGFTLAIPNGIAFGTAITVACTTGLADNDTGAPGANDVVINVGYA